MADLPQITIVDFRKLTARQIKDLKSCDVISDGSYLFTASIPRSDYVKSTVNEMSILSNAVGGKNPDAAI